MSKLLKKSSRPKTQEPRTGLIPVQDLGHAHLPYGTGNLPDALPGARIVTRTGIFSHVINVDAVDDDVAHHPLHDDQENVEMAGLDEDQLMVISQELDEEAVKRANKLKQQWMKWNDVVIPGLLRPYIGLLFQTDSLQNIHTVRTVLGCTGCQLGRLLDIFCVFFDSMLFHFPFVFYFSNCLALEIEKISLCTCSDIPIQLLNMGLFPCAPIFPTLAVDIQLLEFVKELFVNAAPNITAWCNTLESFWNVRGFKLSTRVNICFILKYIICTNSLIE